MAFLEIYFLLPKTRWRYLAQTAFTHTLAVDGPWRWYLLRAQFGVRQAPPAGCEKLRVLRLEVNLPQTL